MSLPWDAPEADVLGDMRQVAQSGRGPHNAHDIWKGPPMSTDLTITHPDCHGDHSFTFTANYSPVLQAAGLPSWTMLTNIRAGMAGLFIGRAHLEIINNRHRYEPLINGDGEWGNWDDLIDRLKGLLKACDQHPDGMLDVS